MPVLLITRMQWYRIRSMRWTKLPQRPSHWLCSKLISRFCLYRRLRSLHARASVSAETTALIIFIGISALATVTSLARQRLPWWTVVSVPFQLVCVLLAIDSRDSLSHIAQAMNTLESVGRHWNTHMAREAVGCAGLLVKLSRRRKKEDLRYLESSMPTSSGPHGPVEPSDTAEEAPQLPTRTGTSTIPAQRISGIDSSTLEDPFTLPAIKWADGMNIEIPENLNIDWSEYEIHLVPNSYFAKSWYRFFDTINWLWTTAASSCARMSAAESAQSKSQAPEAGGH